MHPLFNRWPKTTAIILSIALVGACASDRAVPTELEVAEAVGTANNANVYAASELSGEVNLLVGSSTTLTVRTSSRSRGSVMWASTNPNAVSVNGSGKITAKAEGVAYVTATGFAVEEVYLVTVAPAYRLTSFTVTPTTGTSLKPGNQRQFATSQVWSDGKSRNHGVTFTATGGTISSTGLFTAGNVAGSFMVIANCLCGALDTAFVTVEVPAELSKLAVSPKTVTLEAGAKTQFTASALWNTGATTLPAVAWSATGGSVTSAGQYTAPATAGTYRVILAQSGGTLRDTAVVTVTAPAQLVKLTVSPKTITLDPGAKQQFSASAQWSTGATTLPPVVWSVVGGGSITSAGLYTAPTAAGTYRVILAHNGGTVRDTAVVTVAAPQAPVPPPSSNPSSSWDVLKDFNGGTPGAVTERKPSGFDDASGATVFSTERAWEGGMSGKLTIDSGAFGFGQWGGIVNFPHKLTAGDELWLDLYVYLPADFQIVTQPKTLKFLRVRTQTSAGGNSGYNDVYLADDSEASPQFKFIKEGQDVWYPFGAQKAFTRERWHRFTVHYRFDAVPRSAGGRSQVRVWQNGELILDEHRVQTLHNSTDYASSFYLFTYWNGSSPKKQTAWVDNIRLSNRKQSWVADLPGVDNY